MHDFLEPVLIQRILIGFEVILENVNKPQVEYNHPSLFLTKKVQLSTKALQKLDIL